MIGENYNNKTSIKAFPVIESNPTHTKKQKSWSKRESIEDKMSEKESTSHSKNYSKKVIFFADGTTRPADANNNKVKNSSNFVSFNTPSLYKNHTDYKNSPHESANKYSKQMSKSVDKIVLDDSNSPSHNNSQDPVSSRN